MLIIIGICSIFVIYNVNENNRRTVEINHHAVQEAEFFPSILKDEKQQWNFYVVKSKEKENKQIFDNISRMMDDMKVSWRVGNEVTAEVLTQENLVLVFCDSIVSSYVDLELLGEFIENGGRMVMAAGLADGYTDSYLNPILGIIEKTIKENYYNYLMKEEILPLQQETMSYDGYSLSSWITVRDTAEVMMSEAQKEVPIVYSHRFGNGKVLVFNTTFLNDWKCMGIFVGALGNYLENFIYPVMGTKLLFLDNFPMVTYINDTVSMKLYGRTTEAFVRDVVWPVFQSMSVNNNVLYTSSVACLGKQGFYFPDINDDLFRTLGKSALQFNGEFIYGASLSEGEEPVRNERFLEGFKNTFVNYEVTGLAMMEGNRADQAKELLGKEIFAVRMKPEENEGEGRISYNEDYFIFPEATRNFEEAENGWTSLKSVLAAYGIVSHTFDINELISVDEESAGWDQDKKLLEDFSEEILGETDFLTASTLSDVKNIVKSYTNLKYSYSFEDDKVHLSVGDAMKGQAFFVRTPTAIVEAAGAEYRKINDTYYIVRIQQPEVVLMLQ